MTLPAVLYISYDGMLEPLGQSQVIAYVEGLTDTARFHLISFEKAVDWHDDAKRAAIAERLRVAGIAWHPLRYHKSPTVPATLYDIACGTLLALWLTLRHRVRIIHARSYIAALIGRIVKALTGTKLLFDMRGLWADERVDGGLWPANGRVYRTVKGLEEGLLLAADHIVTLTHASAEVIAAFPYLAGRPLKLSVIPTCADLALFQPQRAAPPAIFTLGYLGSVGTWYMFDEVLEIFRLLRARGPAKLLVINRHERDYILERVAAFGIDQADVELTAVAHRDVPAQIARMSVGAAIIKPVYSKIASAPTKLAEYLGCGVPCLGNTGVGDMQAILEGERVGVALTDFSPADRERAVDALLTLAADPAISGRCREVAERLFSLEQGVTDYRAIYRELLA
jgi:glycosyltransferase involved in cell wall biosynthesis